MMCVTNICVTCVLNQTALKIGCKAQWVMVTLVADRPLPLLTNAGSRRGFPVTDGGRVDVPDKPECGIYVYISMGNNKVAFLWLATSCKT